MLRLSTWKLHFNLKNSLHHFLHKCSGNELSLIFACLGKFLSLTLFLMDSFAGYSIFGSQLLFSTLNILSATHSLLACKTSSEKSIDRFMQGFGESHVCDESLFFLLFSSSLLNFWHFDYNVSSKVLDVPHPNLCFFLGIMDLDVHYLPRFGKFSVISLNKLSILFIFAPSRIFIMWILIHSLSKVSHKSCRFSSLFHSFLFFFL